MGRAAGRPRRLHQGAAHARQPVPPPAISGALTVSAETLLAQAGLIDARTGQAPADGNGDEAEAPHPVPDTEGAIRADPRLSEDQKAALIAVYRSMLGSGTITARES